jgi:heme/copper-type cytochrome/quinol oxidase subunit 2
MADERMLSELGDQVAGQESASAGKKGKPSWLRTVLWMLSMIVLANIVMAIIAYFLFFHNK